MGRTSRQHDCFTVEQSNGRECDVELAKRDMLEPST
jgi:hypothetical protein